MSVAKRGSVIMFSSPGDYLSKDTEYVVTGVDYSTVYIKDDDGDQLELWMSRQEEYGMVVLKEPSAGFAEFDKIIERMEELSTEANNLAQSLGIDAKTVVLSNPSDINEWNSSNC